jgi:hypothetical protein
VAGLTQLTQQHTTTWPLQHTPQHPTTRLLSWVQEWTGWLEQAWVVSLVQ